jgi:8-oxo-dGTP pyrophosphatase MutT (NUDIX family)
MRPSVAAVAQLVAGIRPGEQQEAEDVEATLRWLNETDDVFRRVKPAIPDPHLVSYVVPVDPDNGRILLGEHLNAGLWLPPGGHVEVDEHPTVTAGREAAEELGVDPRGRLIREPLFLSATETVGVDSGHTDVSLWFLLSLRRGEDLRVDRSEFATVRWWSADQIGAVGSATIDPAFDRFITKLTARADGALRQG